MPLEDEQDSGDERELLGDRFPTSKTLERKGDNLLKRWGIPLICLFGGFLLGSTSTNLSSSVRSKNQTKGIEQLFRTLNPLFIWHGLR